MKWKLELSRRPSALRAKGLERGAHPTTEGGIHTICEQSAAYLDVKSLSLVSVSVSLKLLSTEAKRVLIKKIIQGIINL